MFNRFTSLPLFSFQSRQTILGKTEAELKSAADTVVIYI